MGCKTYRIDGKLVMFSELDDEFSCLCTFPHNDEDGISVDRLIELALFGAVVTLIKHGYYENVDEGEYIIIPHDVPATIMEDIRKYRKQFSEQRETLPFTDDTPVSADEEAHRADLRGEGLT